ncbi:LacI family DNA-binding transcriptional regulator [Asticcacaulis sp. EMRT-3]|uniref:LacI family DNA-binding transcriptional regulator n=1 Tax=Asticcacaulis sp. EMRT-3 TaxID=3040349 RepID=UPI0024AF4D04|nr:LacI family DNA-binding transcriptional regulator [Asticcacaulis sp. EMRT-3]MDI7775516.1 LacI family DNA-binding transcriptional regulator [Asticcacaulis sp. EMRT-3]
MSAATLKDIAREAGVSIATASRAINGLDNVTQGVRQRVLEAARSLRYVPHGGARSLVMSRTNTIGVLLPDVYGEFFAEIIRGIDVAARARGLHLLVAGSHANLDEAVAILRAWGGRVDGLLVMSPFVDSQNLAAILPINLPLVTIASRVGQVEQGSISVDNYGGGVTAARHLIAEGRTRIAHISGPAGNFEARERQRGFSAAMKAARLTPHAIYEGDFTEESGYAGTRAFLAQAERPDAIFVANDMMALGCLLALSEAGVRAPYDIAVVGFDDIPISRFTAPPLTTLRVGIFDLGRRGLELLVEALDHGETTAHEGIIVSPELVVRESSHRMGHHAG